MKIENESLQKVDELLQGLKNGTIKLDYSKIPTLQKLHRSLTAHQAYMLDLVITTRAMQSALSKEIYRLGGQTWEKNW